LRLCAIKEAHILRRFDIITFRNLKTRNAYYSSLLFWI
jgi:hypothetical protein